MAPNVGSIFGLSRQTTYQSLHNSDIKRLVSILRDYPQDTTNAKSYWTTTKSQISSLRSDLRSHTLPFIPTIKKGKVKPGKLCSGHRGLNHYLIYSIWAAIQYEFDRAIGKFLYPLLVHCNLPYSDEQAMRHLEPVPEMWQDEFNIMDNTLPGRSAFQVSAYSDGQLVSKWRRQENECPACLLARIGSDVDVLCALLAGMVGRCGPRRSGTKEDVKSKRIRWVRYWIRTFPQGEVAWEQAWDRGERLRQMRKEWEGGVMGTREGGGGFYGTGSRREKFRKERNTRQPYGSVPVPVDISGPFHPGHKDAGKQTAEASRGHRFGLHLPNMGSKGSKTIVTQSAYTQAHFDISAPYGHPHQAASVDTGMDAHVRQTPSPYTQEEEDDVPLINNAAPPSRFNSVKSPRPMRADVLARNSILSWDSQAAGQQPPHLRTPNWISPENKEDEPPQPSHNRRSIYYVGGAERGAYGGFEDSPPGTPMNETPQTPNALFRAVSQDPDGQYVDGGGEEDVQSKAGSRITKWGDLY